MPGSGATVPLAQRLGRGSLCPMGRSQGGEPEALAPRQPWGRGRGGPGWAFGLLTCPWLGADFMKCSIKLFFLMWCPKTRGGEAAPALVSDPVLGACSDDA